MQIARSFGRIIQLLKLKRVSDYLSPEIETIVDEFIDKDSKEIRRIFKKMV